MTTTHRREPRAARRIALVLIVTAVAAAACGRRPPKAPLVVPVPIDSARAVTPPHPSVAPGPPAAADAGREPIAAGQRALAVTEVSGSYRAQASPLAALE